MSWQNKVMNTVEVLRGKAREAAGRITGNARWEIAGRLGQGMGNLKQAGEKVKDVGKSIFGPWNRYGH
jgi:uncharacterized protein YjbJ (UPF0337 family)